MKEKASLNTLEEKKSGRGQARINRCVSGESFPSSYFLYYTLESIVCKFIEYVGNPRPSVIRCLYMYNITGDFAVGCFCHPWPVFAVKSVCGILPWFILVIVFESLSDFSLFLRKKFVPICVFLFYTVAYIGLHTWVALLDSRVSYAGCPSIQSRICLEVGIF